MVEDNTSGLEARLAALEARVQVLDALMDRLLPAVIETARQVGMQRRHVLLVIEAVKTGALNPDEFDSP